VDVSRPSPATRVRGVDQAYAAPSLLGDDLRAPGNSESLWRRLGSSPGRWGRTALAVALRAPFPILAGLTLCWALATPIFGVPDEPTQVIKAAAVANGELVGGRASGPYTAVHVPAGIVGTRYTCFVYQPSEPASCAPPLSGSSRLVPATTYAGRYPPLYYALVGWPTLLVEGDPAIYFMRVITALLAALFLAGAFRSAVSSRHSRLLLVALAAVVTPYVLYFAGSVNPSGVEMPAAICAWTTGLVLIGEPGHPGNKRLVARFAIALAVLVQLRGLGPLFGAVVVGTLMALFGVGPFARLLADRRGRLAAIGVVISAAFCAAWDVSVGGLALLGGTFLPAHTGTWTVLKLSTVRFGQDLVEMVGMFGWWNATFLPRWAYLVWFAVGSGLVAICLLFARGARRAVAVSLAAFSVALPILLVATEAGTKGIVGQGRYWMPLVSGAVLVAAYVFSSHVNRRFVFTGEAVAVVTVAVQLGAFRYALDRYRFGLGGLAAGAPWSPPAGALALMAAYVVIVLLMCLWWRRAYQPQGASRPALATLKLTMAAAVVACSFALTGVSNAAVNTTTYIWSGGDAATGASHTWSDKDNWSASHAPPGSAIGDNLVFPDIAQCDSGRDLAYCASEDDLGTNAVNSVTISGGGPDGAYSLTSATDALELGRGGLTVSPPNNSSRTRITIPVTLEAGQIWTFDRGTTDFDGAVSGTSALTVDLSSPATLDLSGNVDVGDLNLIGAAHRGRSRARVILNGSDLNSSGLPVAIVSLVLSGYGHVGALAASDTALTIGGASARGVDSAGVLTSSADISVDHSSSVTFDLGTAHIGGDSYPQLLAAGNVSLGSAALNLGSGCNIRYGDTFTLVKGASVSGTFTQPDGRTIANDDVIRATPEDTRCSSYFKVTYGAGTVTATRVRQQ
jgi:hypothetical protein